MGRVVDYAELSHPRQTLKARLAFLTPEAQRRGTLSALGESAARWRDDCQSLEPRG